MNDFVLPETVVTQLQGMAQPVHLCDAAGKMLGYFVPKVDSSQYEIVGLEPSEEDLRRVERSTEWYSTEELLQQLEKLG